MRARRMAAGVLCAAMLVAPVAAFERLPQPKADTSLVTPVADLDGPRHARIDTRSQVRYRAAYTRWLHNEYARAGYPVQHRQFRTYVRVVPCCCCEDRWRW
jgi:hypothetical protein